MRERHAVVVSRKWNNPEISIDVDAVGIEIAMSLEDFLVALLAEVGTPVATFTKAQLAQKVKDAAAVVTDGMKQTTVRVM